MVIVFALSTSMILNAQTLSVNVPSSVPIGETFRLEYVIKSTNDDGQIELGNMPDGLEVVYGPSISKHQSVSIVNGHATGSSTLIYTYMLIGNKNGTYSIPSAVIKIGNKVLRSKVVKVKITGKANNTNRGTKFYNQEQEKQSQNRQSGVVSSNDLFIKVSASKTQAYEQEPILITYKVYTLVDLIQLDGKMPDLKGCHSQEIEEKGQKTFHTEKLNGKNYKCVVWKQYVVYPQITGPLEIPSITFKGIVAHQRYDIDPMEAFLNGGSNYYETKHDIKAPSVKINVRQLPAKPKNFSGGVGSFTIKATLNKQQITAGNPINLKVEVRGSGNMKLISPPQLEISKEFKSYDPKATEKIRLTSRGLEGSILYDYVIIPQREGKFTIPSLLFNYYDINQNEYKTIKTAPIAIDVKEGDNDNVEVIDNKESRDEDAKSINIFIWIIGSLLLFAIALFIIRQKKQFNNNIDVVALRAKKAKKIAQKRLSKAESLMRQNKTDDFYDEVIHALWQYISDKMNMSNIEMTKAEIMSRLKEMNVADNVITMFVAAIEDCEQSRYSSQSTHNMNDTYNKAINAIIKIENKDD